MLRGGEDGLEHAKHKNLLRKVGQVVVGVLHHFQTHVDPRRRGERLAHSVRDGYCPREAKVGPLLVLLAGEKLALRVLILLAEGTSRLFRTKEMYQFTF